MHPESTLQKLKTDLPGGELPSSFGVYFKNTLVALCHALEDRILEDDIPEDGATNPHAPLVLVTFQQGKWYLQEADRYLDIAKRSRSVAIAAVPDSGFGQHPTSQLDSVSLVDLKEGDLLANEWNLIILAPNYAAMVLCGELSKEDYWADSEPERDIERKFYGLWTFERQQVDTAAKILIDQMRPYDGDLCDRLEQQRQTISQTLSDTPADLSGVVSRIVTYLQSSQQQLVAINRQNRELSELEGQAQRMNRNLTANKLQAFLRMAQRVDQRDRDNPIASLQVSALAETLGQILDLPTLRLRRLRLAGLLFRIGLAEAPSEVFKSTTKEMDESSPTFWRDRGALGAELMSTMPELAPVSNIVRRHLEHWDGSGRPSGLKGEEIPLESRILGLVAYFQGLTQPRGDRPALSLGEAFEHCSAASSTRFDPQLVDSLSTLIRLAEIGMLQLPDRPSQMPTVWLEEVAEAPR